MTLAAFDQANRAAYVTGLAQSFSLAPSAVSIASVTQLFSRRRRDEFVAVETVAEVPKELAPAVVAAVTVENLSAALASSGMAVGSVSVPKTDSALTGSTSGDGGSEISAGDSPAAGDAPDVSASEGGNVGVIAGAGAAAVLLALAVGVCVWWRCRRNGRAEDLPRHHHPGLDGAGSVPADGIPSAPPLASSEVSSPPRMACGVVWRLLEQLCSDRCVRQLATPGDGVPPSSPASASASVGFKQLVGRDKAAVDEVPYAHLIVESAPMAEGSYKSVYRATWHRGGDRASPMTVALMKLRSSQGDVAALAAEVKVFVQLGKHPNLATLLGATKHPDGSPCMLVEYAALGSLDNVLAGPAGGGRETSEEVRLTVATQICEGMAQLALHGVVHRDLASRNVSGPHALCV